MTDVLSKPDLHLFICTHQRETGEDCSHKGSLELFREVKGAVKADPKLSDKIKVSRSGCLGLCSMGIAGVHYPEGKWLIELKPESHGEVLREIRSKLPPSES